MNKLFFIVLALFMVMLTMTQCSKDKTIVTPIINYPSVNEAFGTNIDLNKLTNYANQTIPNYITKDNTAGNALSDAKATLGRVLFYDKNLSIDNTISCGSCHQQEFAFSDPLVVSNGVSGGVTSRHSMRLINARFSAETKFFWDERAASLEEQTTRPIQDHAEMGYSGQNGRPDLNAMITKLEAIGYYNELFTFTYGDESITEERLQECLSTFIRSIQSFDSKYDVGRAQVNNDNQNFPNFTTQENTGKNLFINPPTFDGNGIRVSGGLGCQGCHKAPEFDIDPNALNNGVTGVANASGTDLTNTRSPSLRDLTNNNGTLNTPLMHTGEFTSIEAVINHYGNISLNTNLDQRLRPNGQGQKLNLTTEEINSVIAFLKTLSGTNVYTDTKWSDPFK